MSNIQGVNYNLKTAEHQYFPEEFFSGSDVTINFDDIFMDDVMALEFSLMEKTLPVYGYNSYTFDAVARGQRLVQGSFTIAFREAGYLYRVFEHIGGMKEKAKPLIAYQLGGQNKDVPKWLGNINETIEDLVGRAGGNTTAGNATVQPAPEWPTMKFGDTGEHVKELQRFFIDEAGTGRFKGITGMTGYGLTQTMKRGNSGGQVKSLQMRLNAYLYGTGLIKQKLAEDGVFGTGTENAVRTFQKVFTPYAVDGIVGEKTRSALNMTLAVSGTFATSTKFVVMRFQHANKLKVDGVVGPKTLEKMQVSVDIKAEQQATTAEGQFADYEASIWGEQSTYDSSFKHQPHFYGSANQVWLRTDGFDIYINYGELPDAMLQDGVKDKVTFHNTVKAIRNVQITGVDQVIGSSGEPIAERYTFFAKDLD